MEILGNRLTHYYTFLRNPVLIINKAVLLHRVTHPNQVFCHFFDEVLAHEALRGLYSLTRLQHIFLFLKYTEPRIVELSPESYSIAMKSNFVYSKALIRNH
jgi:hypothetical protein